MPYEYTNKRGQKYYLHSRPGPGGRKIYFFSRNPKGAEQSLPPGYTVVESERTGLPLLTKKAA